jgi:hypothetical protein
VGKTRIYVAAVLETEGGKTERKCYFDMRADKDNDGASVLVRVCRRKALAIYRTSSRCALILAFHVIILNLGRHLTIKRNKINKILTDFFESEWWLTCLARSTAESAT